MSNSIRRARRRPRKHSSSLTAFWWLVRRVAVWTTIYGERSPANHPGAARLFLSKNWKHLECAARREFAFNTFARYQP